MVKSSWAKDGNISIHKFNIMEQKHPPEYKKLIFKSFVES